MTPLPESLLESLAAEAVREGLADALFTRLRSPIGDLTVVQGAGGILRVSFEEEPEDRVLAEVAAVVGPRILRSERELAVARDAFEAYFAGEGDLDLPYDLRLVRSPFRRGVLETLRHDVGRGSVIRYGELAARAGNPRAHRAAATACARNPIPLVVPCHRVVPAAGGIGNYGGGVPRKARLLELEGVTSR